MEKAESDDDTLEFEIEVVESSSSISLASTSVADLASVEITCQKVVDQQTEVAANQMVEEEEEVDENKKEEIDPVPCEDSKESGKVQDNEKDKQPSALKSIYETAVNEDALECKVENKPTCINVPPSLLSCESELSGKKAQSLKQSPISEESLTVREQQVCESGNLNDNLGKRKTSMIENSPKADEKINEVDECNSLKVEHFHPQDDAADVNHRTNTTPVKAAPIEEDEIPNKIQINDETGEVKQGSLEPELIEHNDILEVAENQVQQLEKETIAINESDPNDAESNRISGELAELNKESIESGIIESSLPQCPAEAIDECQLDSSVSAKLIELKRELIRENIYLNGITEAIKSELVDKLAANYSEEVVCTERYPRKQEADGKSSTIEHNILLEVIEHSTDQQQQQLEQQATIQAKTNYQDLTENYGLSLDQIKQATQKRRVSFGGGISRSASNYSVTTCGEDLEQEFDNEPDFERRQVEVKRNRDIRDEYELGEELGRGRFGTVRKCVEKCENGRKLAAKFVNMRRREDREDVEREVYIMSLLQHKRLLQLYDAFDNGKDEMCLVTELIEGGELFERIIDDDFELTEKKAAIFMRQICQGVEYMHSQQVVHLDMKPENILCVSKTGNRIKLIDFGLARQLKLNETLRVMFGTPDFAAPEVLAYDIVSFATDMWSVGVICYVLLSGLSPFMGDNDIETMANVTKATYDFDDKAFDPISDLAKDFISKLLVREQDKRLKPTECLKHPWLQRGGIQLEANIRSRRESMVISMLQNNTNNLIDETILISSLEQQQQQLLNDNGDNLTPPILLSLDKRNLKKYVIRRKWHKTVHAIMALGRMGANLKF